MMRAAIIPRRSGASCATVARPWDGEDGVTRIGRFLLGHCAAATGAATVFALMVGLPNVLYSRWWDPYWTGRQDIYGYLRNGILFPLLMFFIVMWISSFFASVAPSYFLYRASLKHQWRWHCFPLWGVGIAVGLTPVFVLLTAHMALSINPDSPPFFQGCLGAAPKFALSGLVGGLAFWFAAGRRAKPTPPGPRANERSSVDP